MALMNDAQRNSLKVSLRLLEKQIFFLELLIDRKDFHGQLYRLRVDLSEAEMADVKEKFGEIRRLIGTIQQKFQIPAHEDLFSDHLKSTASYYWSVFEDEKAAKLNRYGKVSRHLAKELDPLIEQLLEYLNDLHS